MQKNRAGFKMALAFNSLAHASTSRLFLTTRPLALSRDENWIFTHLSFNRPSQQPRLHLQKPPVTQTIIE
jgi:hypothetical protein